MFALDDSELGIEEASKDMDEESFTDHDSAKEKYHSLGPLIWSSSIRDHVTVNFDKGFKIGEISQIDRSSSKARIDFMQSKPPAKHILENFGFWDIKIQSGFIKIMCSPYNLF